MGRSAMVPCCCRKQQLSTTSGPPRRNSTTCLHRLFCLALAMAVTSVGLADEGVMEPRVSVAEVMPRGESSLRQGDEEQRKQQLKQQQQQTKTNEWERMHVIRRLYGPESADLRREVSLLEERMERYRTGFNGDPNHRVDYENHPYDKRNRRRWLQNGGGSEGGSGVPGDLFRPMRIVFKTQALDDMRDEYNADKIDWIKRVILPRTSDFWSQALSVVPVSGPLRISASELDARTHCGDLEFTEVPTQHISYGVDDADLVLYVSGTPSARFCPERTLAVAVPCNFDQFDRPTAGAINVCLDQIVLDDDGTATDAVVQDYVDVSIHETGHVLGHSSNSYRFFWDPHTGTPRTSRPFEARTVECVDGQSRTLILPAENTMVFGHNEHGRRYASVVTPKVRTIARNQFDCPSLEGAQLENQPTRAESCFGDHWDERLFYPEAMSGVISPTTNVLSSLTLALMEDSGWYKANYTMTRMSPWGLGAGCGFVNDPCLDADTITGETSLPDYSRGFFCDTPQDKGCSSELTHKMACTVIDYYFFVPQNLPAVQFQYFPEEPTKGGPRQADFCPVYGSTYNQLQIDKLDCTNPDNGQSIAKAFNVYSEVYGPDSKCIPSSTGEGKCYRTACVEDEMALKINIRGIWFTCRHDFQELEIGVEQGTLPQKLICPRLSQACPDLFCPFNCAGGGVCNYANSVNGTVRPKCECFDPDDDSPACSDSMIPDGGFLEDSTGLFNNLEENFFDPLIAVFVDHPSTWSTASWAWAAGLITIFVILLLCICSSFMPERRRKY